MTPKEMELSGEDLMIAPDVKAKILRLHHVEQWPLGTIARHLGLHHTTVRRVLVCAGIEEAEAHRLAIYYNGVIQSLQLMAHSRTDPDIVHGFMDTALNELRKYAP